MTARAKLLEECLSIDTALLLFIIVAAAAVPSAKPQPKRSNWLFLLHSLLLCLCASVHTFPSTWSALLHCTPCLPLIVLLKYHLLHAALQDPPPPPAPPRLEGFTSASQFSGVLSKAILENEQNLLCSETVPWNIFWDHRNL